MGALLIALGHEASSLLKHWFSAWPVLPHTAQEGLAFLVRSLLALEFVARKAAEGEVRLPSRW